MTLSQKRILHIAATFVFLGLGVLTFVLLTANKPQLKRTVPPPAVPMVRTVAAESGSVSIPIIGEGTVRPVREIQLVSEVGGRVVYVSPSLVDGGNFRKGEVLVRIEPTDYELAVTLARAQIKDSESTLQLAEEEAAAAKEEWLLLNANRPAPQQEPPPLVAKLPQLEAARAKLSAERANLQKAVLNLERTQLKAPFDGRVGEQQAGVGQYASVGQALATLYSTETAEIIVPLEDETLFWFHVPGFTPGNGPGSPAKVTARIAGRDRQWRGRVERTEGNMDEGTRMINVVVQVPEPYAVKPPLATGLFVQVEIEGRTLENAIVIPRAALRRDDSVWVVDENGTLSFRSVAVARLYPDKVILRGGLEQNEQVVVSALKAVTDGMKVRVAQSIGENRS